MAVVVDGFRSEDTEAVLGLSRRTWEPVMAGMRSQRWPVARYFPDLEA